MCHSFLLSVTLLTLHNLDSLFCCLCSLAASWKKIGQELGVHLETEWTVPQKKPKLEPIALLHQILYAWLNSSDTLSDQFKEQPTLEKLCSALRSPSIMGGKEAASNLEQHWNQQGIAYAICLLLFYTLYEKVCACKIWAVITSC